MKIASVTALPPYPPDSGGRIRTFHHDADLKTAEGLLGRDFLEHFTVTIDAKERLVTLVPK